MTTFASTRAARAAAAGIAVAAGDVIRWNLIGTKYADMERLAGSAL